MVAPDLHRRWLISAALGFLHGAGFSSLLKEDIQFAGRHLLLSLVSFDVGVAFGQILALLLALWAFALLFKHVLRGRLGVVILSALLAHSAWHCMLDAAHRLWHTAWPIRDATSVVVLARWTVLVMVLGAAAWFLPKQSGLLFQSSRWTKGVKHELAREP